MGGDNSPDKTIEGVSLFVKKYNINDYLINIFGKENEILRSLKKYNCNTQSIKIIHTESIVSNDESP